MTTQEGRRQTGVRWLKFNAVGGGGIIVQLAALAVFKSALQMSYLTATALAVEVAIIHNYFWHERFTWVDRATGDSWVRFLRFNLTTGVFSILGNVVLMRCFVTGLHVHYVAANVLTIATCSAVNFLVSDLIVFEAE
jgi:putative flippase GtrA